MKFTLRDYQEECVAAHYDYFARNARGHPLFVVPTGGGKSLIIAEFIKRTLDAWPDQRVLVLTHVKELIAQNFEEFCDHVGASPWSPGRHVAGIYSAGLRRRDTDQSVLFAGIQSIYRRADELGHFDLVLIDEAHLVPKKGLGRYRSYLEALERINPAVKVCGYTATHYRLDGGYLHIGDGRIFTDVAYEVRLETLVEAGHLVPLVAKAVENPIDTSSVATSRGDFVLSQLEEAALDVVNDAVFEAVMTAAMHDRRHWLFFASGIEHAKAIASCLFDQGIDVATIFGDTPREEREKTVKRFRDGKLTALVNVGVLTTGFNAPRCDLMAVMRPTQSTALYVQIMGRGMRTFPGKTNCLVLDYGENVMRHGPINKVRPKKHGGGEAPAKECPECKSIVALGVKQCPECGYLWPWEPPTRSQTRKAETLAPFDPNAHKPRVYVVDSVHYREHNKPGKPTSLRVDYQCGMRMISDWVCLEHGGYATRKACDWWQRNGGAAPIPYTTAEALKRAGELDDPVAIEVVDDGKYERVRRVLFETEECE
jgi:DNA repair protein RadD